MRTSLDVLGPLAPAQGEEGCGRSARVDALFARWSEGKKPGAAVMVILKGVVVHKKGYGFANLETGERIGHDTNFRLASISKQFTAMAIMILSDRGNLRYNDALSRFFPVFPAYARKITVEKLLHHTSGLQEYDKLFQMETKIGCDWPRSSKTKPDDFEPTARDTLDLLARQDKLDSPPGDSFKYSNSGYVVLGQIVEQVSGKSYAEFLKGEIFQPLRMKHTIVSDGKRPNVPKLAKSYTSSYSPAQEQDMYHEIDYTPLNRVYGDDGVHSSIDDMWKWAEALDGATLVKRKTLRLAFTPGTLNNEALTDYGFGWIIDREFGEKRIWHNGEWIGFRTYIARYPRRQITVIVLANCKQLDSDEMGSQVAKIYLDK